jgi:hypothetical protein
MMSREVCKMGSLGRGEGRALWERNSGVETRASDYTCRLPLKRA